MDIFGGGVINKAVNYGGDVLASSSADIGAKNSIPTYLISGNNKRIKVNDNEAVTVLDHGTGLGLNASKVTLGGDPTAALEAATKQYTDTKVATQYDQSLNTSDEVKFDTVTTNTDLIFAQAGKISVPASGATALQIGYSGWPGVINLDATSNELDLTRPVKITNGYQSTGADSTIATTNFTVDPATTTTIKGNAISTTQWGYLAGQDQALDTTATATFSDVTSTGALTVNGAQINGGTVTNTWDTDVVSNDLTFTESDTRFQRASTANRFVVLVNKQFHHTGFSQLRLQCIVATGTSYLGIGLCSLVVQACSDDGGVFIDSSGGYLTDKHFQTHYTSSTKAGDPNSRITTQNATSEAISAFGSRTYTSGDTILITYDAGLLTFFNETTGLTVENAFDLNTYTTFQTFKANSDGMLQWYTVDRNSALSQVDYRILPLTELEHDNNVEIKHDLKVRGHCEVLGNQNIKGPVICSSSLTFNKPLAELFFNGENTLATACSDTVSFFPIVAPNTGTGAGTATYLRDFELVSTLVSGSSYRHELKYTGSTTKLFHCGASFSNLHSSGADREYDFVLYKNNTTAITSSELHMDSTTAVHYSTALHGFIELAQNDTITLAVKSPTASSNITVDRLNLFVAAFPNTVYN